MTTAGRFRLLKRVAARKFRTGIFTRESTYRKKKHNNNKSRFKTISFFQNQFGEQNARSPANVFSASAGHDQLYYRIVCVSSGRRASPGDKKFFF